MADCTRCGRKLPAISFGSGGLCDNCRQAEQDEIQPGGHASQLISPWSTGPAVTLAIIGINVAVYLAMVLNGVSPVEPTGQQLVSWGADFGPYTVSGQSWRLLTSAFEHAGIIHIALNMWGLWVLGRVAEHIYDKGTFLGAYVLCGIGGGIASLFWEPAVVMVGASGAIFGLLGLLLTTFWLGESSIARDYSRGMMANLLIYGAYSLYRGATVPGISNSAHLGGLFTGLILGGLMAPSLTNHPHQSRGLRWMILTGSAVALFVLFQVVKASVINSLQGIGS